MADPRLIIGRIVSVEGTSPGPATFISYTIAVHDPAVEGIFRLEGQRPIQRWPDLLDTVALPVGMLVIGAIEANVVRWHFMELPAFADCTEAAPAATIARRFQELSGMTLGPGGLGPITPGTPDSAPISEPSSGEASQ